MKKENKKKNVDIYKRYVKQLFILYDLKSKLKQLKK